MKYCVVKSAVLKVLQCCLELYLCLYVLSPSLETTQPKIVVWLLMVLFEKGKVSWIKLDIIIANGWIGRAWIEALGSQLSAFKLNAGQTTKKTGFKHLKSENFTSHEMGPMGEPFCLMGLWNKRTEQKMHQNKLNDDTSFWGNQHTNLIKIYPKQRLSPAPALKPCDYKFH